MSWLDQVLVGRDSRLSRSNPFELLNIVGSYVTAVDGRLRHLAVGFEVTARGHCGTNASRSSSFTRKYEQFVYAEECCAKIQPADDTNIVSDHPRAGQESAQINL